MIKKNILIFFFIITIFIIDRISKILIIRFNDISENSEIIITNFLSFNLVWNSGIAFGFFSFEDKFFYNSITIIIALVTLAVLWMIFLSRKLEKYGFALIFSGAIGNIFDRILYSSVPDFIDLHYENFHWFTFNVADISICMGVVLLIFCELKFKKKL